MKNIKMKNFKWLAAGLIMFFVVGVVGAAFMGKIPSRNSIKAKRVSHTVLRFPVGSSKAQIAAFLKQEGLEHSYVGDKEGIDFTSAVSDNGYSSANLSGYMVAIIRDTSGGFMFSGDVQYFFFFDKKGKLIKATAEEILTGP